MGTSCNYRIIENPEGYLSLIASAIKEQMEGMVSIGHPFRDIVRPSQAYWFVGEIHKGKGVNVFTLTDGTPIGAIGFQVVPLWWAKEGNAVLVEEFIVCLNHSYAGFGRIAVKRLEELAKNHKCSLIMSGNLLGNTPKQTENLYMKKANFNFSYKQFLKVL